jgi:hypothetical protein
MLHSKNFRCMTGETFVLNVMSERHTFLIQIRNGIRYQSMFEDHQFERRAMLVEHSHCCLRVLNNHERNAKTPCNPRQSNPYVPPPHKNLNLQPRREPLPSSATYH